MQVPILVVTILGGGRWASVYTVLQAIDTECSGIPHMKRTASDPMPAVPLFKDS